MNKMNKKATIGDLLWDNFADFVILIIFVVGNKKIGNETINGGEFFKKIILQKPDYIVEREYSVTASKIWDKINKTERKEQIIVWDKSKW